MQRCSHSFSTATALRSIFFPTSNQTCISTFLTPSYATDFAEPYPLYQQQSRSQSSYSRASYASSQDPAGRAQSISRQPYDQSIPRQQSALGASRPAYTQNAQRQPFDQGNARQPYNPGGQPDRFSAGVPRQPFTPGGPRQPQEQGGARQPYNTGGAREPYNPGSSRQSFSPGPSRQSFSPGPPRNPPGRRSPNQTQTRLRPEASDPALRKFGAQEERKPKDEEIQSAEILLVEKGAGPPKYVYLRDVLRRIDREKEMVVQVGLEGESEGASKQDSAMEDDLDSDDEAEAQQPVQDFRTPVCKIMSRKDYFMGEQKRGKTGSGAVKKPKELELTWNVDKNDLKHRLSKAEGFLADGKKVEIFLAPKRRGKPVSVEDAQAMVKEIKDRLLQGTSNKEYKEMEGKVGETVTMFFEKK